MKLDTSVTIEQIQARNAGTMCDHLGIEFLELTPEYLSARMPVDRRTRQPLGLLNGGASAALAETVGSTAAYLTLDRERYYCVGIEIKCNHLRSATEGWVTGKATPIHTGRKTHLWLIEITDQQEQRVCYATLTLAVLEREGQIHGKINDLFKQSS